jgi:hypothetical protein
MRHPDTNILMIAVIVFALLTQISLHVLLIHGAKPEPETKWLRNARNDPYAFDILVESLRASLQETENAVRSYSTNGIHIFPTDVFRQIHVTLLEAGRLKKVARCSSASPTEILGYCESWENVETRMNIYLVTEEVKKCRILTGHLIVDVNGIVQVVRPWLSKVDITEVENSVWLKLMKDEMVACREERARMAKTKDEILQMLGPG